MGLDAYCGTEGVAYEVWMPIWYLTFTFSKKIDLSMFCIEDRNVFEDRHFSLTIYHPFYLKNYAITMCIDS